LLGRFGVAAIELQWKSTTTVAMAEPYLMSTHLARPDSQTTGVSRQLGFKDGIVPTSLQRGLSWLAVYTRTRHEKSVARNLVENGIECFLPLYSVERRWSNQRRAIVDLPLFQNYLLSMWAQKAEFRF
jgi:hypothetical protein